MATTDNTLEVAQRTGLANILSQVTAEGHADPFAGKRDRQRYASSRRFELRCKLGGEHQTLAVVLRNISGTGVAVWSHHEIPADVRILVRPFDAEDDEPWLLARVTHCTAGVGGFLVGAKFDYPIDNAGPVYEADESEDEAWSAPEQQRRGGLLARLFAHRAL